MKKPNFTLLELFVVVCIILVLISLLMPASRRALQQAKFAVCTSNIQQIYRGHYLYCTNNNMYMPCSYDNSTGYSWDDFLSPYLSRPLTQAQMAASSVPVDLAKGSVLQCPADKNGSANRRSYAVTGGSYAALGYDIIRKGIRMDRSYSGVAHTANTTGIDPNNRKSSDWFSSRITRKGPQSKRIFYREICLGQAQGSSTYANANHDWGGSSGPHLRGPRYLNALYQDGHSEYKDYSLFQNDYHSNSDYNSDPTGN
jgi:Tfp pilus assembly protein PilE